MRSHPNPIIEGFLNLANFRGRTSRRRYWPYAAVVIACYWVLGTIISVAMMVPMMTNLVRAVQASPERAAVINPASMIPNLQAVLIATTILLVVTAALLAAATVRRLHDRGLPGWLALAPLPATVASEALSWSRSSEDMIRAAQAGGAPGWALAVTAAYWISLLALAVFLLLPGQEGANRHGLPPFDADR